MVRDRIPGEVRDFPPVQAGPGAHPASCKMGMASFPGIKCGRGVLLTAHPLLVPHGGMDWIELAQVRDRWRALATTVMNLRVP